MRHRAATRVLIVAALAGLSLQIGCLATNQDASRAGSAREPVDARAPAPFSDADTSAQNGMLNVLSKIDASLAKADRLLSPEVQIGGGGDGNSVTAWIQAAAPWLTWLLYPLVWRPATYKLGMRTRNANGESPP